MEKSNFDESVSFFPVLMRENMYRPRCEKKDRKNYKQNKLEREREGWEKRKHNLFSSSSLPMQKGCRGDIVAYNSSTISRTYCC